MSTDLGEKTLKLRIVLRTVLAYFIRPKELGVATVGGLAFAVVEFHVLLDKCDDIGSPDTDETQLGEASKWMILCHDGLLTKRSGALKFTSAVIGTLSTSNDVLN